MSVLTEQELTKLRVAIATLPINPGVKRTWLGVIASIDSIKEQQERTLAILAEAKQEHYRARVLFFIALVIYGAAIGITTGAFF